MPTKTEKVNRLVLTAARKVDAKRVATKELGGHYLTAANAVKSGRPVPSKSARAIHK